MSLPKKSEQAWLVDRLAELIAKQGWQTFVLPPLREPNSTCFPVRWSEDGLGYRDLACQLLDFACLIEQIPQVVIVPPGVGREFPWAACFMGIEDKVCKLAVNTHQVSDPISCAGAMAHEVTHVYRTYHGLCMDDVPQEELLTDLTTIYLGFGLLTTNSTYQFRQQSTLVGPIARHSWTHARLGYLPLEAMAFLLGIQLVVRNPEPEEYRRYRSFLGANQREALDRVVERLEDDADGLRSRLGIPDPSEWPSRPRELCAPCRSADSQRGVVAWLVTESGTGPHPPVQRVAHAQPGKFALFGLLLGALISFAAQPVLPKLGLDGLGAFAMVAYGLMAIMGIAGSLLGRKIKIERCSNVGCGLVIPRIASVCPGCQRAIRDEAPAAGTAAPPKKAETRALPVHGAGSYEEET